MNSDDVRRLYRYNDWANRRMFDVIDSLPDGQITREIVSSFPSIRETLAHIGFAEWLWLRRWQGQSPSEEPEWVGKSVSVVREQLQSIAAERNAYLRALTDDAIASTLDYRSMKGDPFTMPLGELLIHCANHSTYHRGQLVTMFRQVGATAVPTTDYTAFSRETR